MRYENKQVSLILKIGCALFMVILSVFLIYKEVNLSKYQMFGHQVERPLKIERKAPYIPSLIKYF